MASRLGCLKPVLFGCLGLILIVLLVVGIAVIMARRGMDDAQVETRDLTPLAEMATTDFTGKPGRVILDLAHGEFEVFPAEPGEGISVEARYDITSYELVDELETAADSTWTYRLSYHRTIPGLQALLRSIFGEGIDSYVHVYLPPDAPIELEISVAQGGCEAEIGGMWITDANILFDKGGFALSVDDPLREPMNRFVIRGQMGGFETARLGNASPRVLDVDCKMGGAEIDLRGDWVRDCDISLTVNMGGMEVTLPDNVEVEGIDASEPRLRRGDSEVPIPVLRFETSQRRGEIEFSR